MRCIDCPKQERWEEPDVEYFEHSSGSGGRAQNTAEDDLEINGGKARDGKVCLGTAVDMY